MREPKYRRHTLRDFAFVEFEGRRVRLPGRYNSAKSRAAYHQFIQKHLYEPSARDEAEAASIQAKTAADALRGGRVTVGGLILAWLDFARTNYPAGHSSEYRNCKHAVTLLATLFGRCAVDEFGPVKLKRVQEAMVVSGSGRNYVNGQLNRIKRMFKWGVSEELVQVNVQQSLLSVSGLREGRTTAKEAERREPADWKDVAPVFEHLPPPVVAMLWLQWYTGARTKSICLATPEQFDRTKESWEWRPRHKSEHLRKTAVIFIGPKLQVVLAPFFDRPADALLFSPREAAVWWNDQRQEKRETKQTRREGLVSIRIREGYDTGTYRQAIRRAQKKAGVPHWTPHQLRHARGTLVRETYGLEAAQAVLCHESIDATQIYARRRQDVARQIAAETG